MVDVTNDEGVKKHIIVEGEGDPPQYGEKVYILYSLFLSNGAEIDRRLDPSMPFSFRLGRSSVIPGLEFLLLTMKPGETAQAVIKAPYAFGTKGVSGKIAPDASIDIKVTLVSVEHVEEKSYNLKDMTPRERFDAAVLAKEEGNSLFKQAKYALAIDKYETALLCLYYVPLETDLKRFAGKKNGGSEKSTDDQLLDSGLQRELDESLNQVLEIDNKNSQDEEDSQAFPKATIEVLDENENEDQPPQEIQQGEEQNGARYDANKEEEMETILQQLETIPAEEIKALHLAVLNNLALCSYKEGENQKAVRNASKALEIDDSSSKAYYYRGRAYSAIGDYDKSKEDLLKAAKLAPKDTAVRIELEKLEKKIKNHSAREKRAAAAMFS